MVVLYVCTYSKRYNKFECILNIYVSEYMLVLNLAAYELWFKQIIFELNSIKELFSSEVSIHY